MIDMTVCHYPENSPNDTAIVIPAKERHPVPRYGAGIQFPAPAISLAATERPSSFSCFVVSVATDMSDSSENSPVQPAFVGSGFKPALQSTNATPSFLRRNVTPYPDTGQESILRLLPREDDEAKPIFMFRGVGGNRHEGFL